MDCFSVAKQCALETALCHATCVTSVMCCKRSGFIWTSGHQLSTHSIFTASRHSRAARLLHIFVPLSACFSRMCGLKIWSRCACKLTHTSTHRTDRKEQEGGGVPGNVALGLQLRIGT